MEELFKTYAGHVALFVEVIAAVVITVGAIQAVIGFVESFREKSGKTILPEEKGLAGFWCLAAVGA